VLQFASFSFDAFVSELVTTLSVGASLHLGQPGQVLAGSALAELLARDAITHVTLPPVVLGALDDTALDSVSTLVVAGEAPSAALVRRWGAARRLINAYGPTESTVCTTMHLCDLHAHGAPPIGRPIDNARVYLLDEQGRAVPVGVAGHLHVGGEVLARGYLNRPELTAERFVSDPFVPGQRMYKTGDLARYRADGTLEYLGRNDFQVKIRGMRVELGEVEACLARHDGVREAVVIARDGGDDGKRLVAYVVGENLSPQALREHAALTLPQHMVPAACVVLDALPLTPNGKLDRHALPAPENIEQPARVHEEPLGEVESTIARIWADVLQLDQVGRHDNFFELGGHSLLAVKVASRMRQAGLRVDVNALFDTPSLAEFAACASSEEQVVEVPPNRIPPGCERITPDMLPLVRLTQEDIDRIAATVRSGAANIQDIYPLAPLQQGILFHHRTSESDVYLAPAMFAFDSRARLDAFLTAFQAVVDRHDILRTCIVWEDLPEPVQVVLRHARLQVQEVVADPEAGDVAAQLRSRFDPRRHRMDVTEAPLMRLFVAEDTSNARWVMLLWLHHLAIDHTTLENLQHEIQAHLLGRAEQLPAALPFRNFVAQARLGVGQDKHEAFFRDMLADIDEPTAPFGLLDVQGDGSLIDEAACPVDDELAVRLRARAQASGVSVASLCHLAWAQVLARITGRRDVVFGTVLFGRVQGGSGAERVLGLFINTLPLRVEVGDATPGESLKATHQRLSHLMRHEHASLALAQRCSGVSPSTPLFSALLNYRHSAASVQTNADTESAWRGIQLLSAEERTNYPFTLSVDDLGAGFMLTAQVQQPADPRRVCAMMHMALRGLADALDESSLQPIHRLDVLPPDERRWLVSQWNETRADFPRHLCAHELIEARAAAQPGAPALAMADAVLSYGELNQRANRLARHLRDAGVRPDARVAICMERSFEMVVGLLAVLKAGGAYVPVDPAYPAQRVAYMLEDSAPVAVLTRGRVRDELRAAIGAVPVLDLAAGEAWETRSPEDLPREETGLRPEHLAYVIYTSGSTGRPKGVMIEHRGLVNYLCWAGKAYAPADGSVVSSSLSFDATITSVFTPLIHGSTARLLADGREVDDLEVLLASSPAPGLVKITPAHLDVLGHRLRARGSSPAVGMLVVGGEALSPATVKLWRDIQPRVRVVNEYGPTETVVGCIVYEVGPEEEPVGNVPIGRPIANTQIYLLDSAGRPVPVGATGEIHIGGAGVARGYLNRPELSAERFVPDPFSAEPGARMYKTGDLARHRPDGQMEYLGRNDFQVKLRGFRIELGEIEARLAQHPQVREAVVIAREDNPGDKRLVAYLVGDAPQAQALREHLAAELPDHMVPAAYVLLDAIPLTPNGKVDRKALPTPDAAAYASRGYQAPEGEVEAVLARIWAEVLKLDRVGRHDNFFELGGHSLLAVTVLERMRREGLQADVRRLFDSPTIAALAASIDSRQAAVTVPPNRIPEGSLRITPDMLPLVPLSTEQIERIVATVPGGAANVQDIYPLAPLQEGIFFHHLMGSGGDLYLQHALFAFAERAQLERYAQALQTVVDRHDVLRTAVFWDGLPEPVQVVWRHAPLELRTVTLDPGADAAGQLLDRFHPRRHRIGLDRAPLLQLIAAHDARQSRWVMLLLFHHLAGDHTALDVIQGEIQSLMAHPGQALPPSVPFRNFVAQARLGVSQQEHEAFFRDMLGDIDEPTAPFGLVDVLGDTSVQVEARRAVPRELGARLRRCARRLGVSAASLHHLAWAQVLARAASRDDVVFGTLLFGRMQGGEGSHGAVGMFINTLPIRITVDDTPVAQAAKAVHARLGQLMRHEHAPLALAQRCSAVPAQTPLFNALLNYRHSPSAAPLDEEMASVWEGIELLGGEERTNYPLTLSIDDVDDGFVLSALAHAPLDPERICDHMETALARLADALEHEPELPASSLDVLPAEERQRLLVEWNATRVDFSQDACLHELFEQQVLRSGDAVAVVDGTRRVDYRELNRRANRLAHHLRRLGVGADDRVAVCAERSLEMVTALLAVLKAGAAYVPLDPDHPLDRLAAMCEDSAPAAVLADDGIAQPVRTRIEAALSLRDAPVPVLRLQSDTPSWAGESDENPVATDIGLRTHHLAYVIYTSGSTGQPKGVMNEHRGVVNRLLWMQQAYGLGAHDAVLQKTPFSFDVSVWEFFWPLLQGARLVMARPGGHKDPAYLCEIIREQRITTLHFVPSMLQAFLAHADMSGCASLRRVVCSGEALPPALARQCRQRLPHADLHNLYGPTEAAVDVTAWTCPREGPVDVVPIGRPIANTAIYLLDPRGRPVPEGAIGELHIGGVQVARGYLHRPELSAERFVSDPFSPEPGARMYKTGDLARHLPGGDIEYLGRNDFQVKLRGLRIEPGEIESVLMRHPGVAQASVGVRDFGDNDRRLVAHVVPSSRRAALVQRLLRMQRRDPHAAANRIELPNGWPMFHRNQGETDFVFQEIFVQQAYLKYGLNIRDGDCIFDVGANIGMFTLFAARQARDTRVYAFEPVPPLFETLARNAELHGLEAKLFRCGLAAAAGREVFSFYPHNTVISSSQTTPAQAREMVKAYLRTVALDTGDGTKGDMVDELLDTRLDVEHHECELQTLSQVIRDENVQRIDLLKIDVENAEAQVIAGIDDADWPKIRQIVVEVHDVDGRPWAIADLLHAKGFAVSIEQDKALHGTRLYNLYALRPATASDDDGQETEAGPAKAIQQHWHSPESLLADLKAHLAGQLPDHMVPSAFVLIDEMPLTPSGKLDRKALPDPVGSAPTSLAYVPPQGDTETEMAAIWAAILQTDRVGRHDNFFELGGHSLLATKLIARLRHEMDIDLPLQSLFAAPDLASFAELTLDARLAKYSTEELDAMSSEL
jgi:arthrofactin-type cyclic lipopeptide synthetase B